jgi:hypothetical protein
MFGVSTVIVPSIAFAIGWLFVLLIPGCNCNEGTGCHGCWANGLVTLLLFWGFAGAAGALFTLFPLSLAVAAVIGILSRRR